MANMRHETDSGDLCYPEFDILYFITKAYDVRSQNKYNVDKKGPLDEDVIRSEGYLIEYCVLRGSLNNLILIAIGSR